MELSLCSISSYSPASPSSSFLSPRCPCVRLLRKEFLGCCHNLRPPGLRSTRQCKMLGFPFHFYSKSALFRASLLDSSQSTVFLVAVAAVSAALSIVFLNPSKSKSHTQDMQMSGQLTHPPLRHIGSMMNCLFADESTLPVDSEGKITIDNGLNVRKETSSINVCREDIVAEMPLGEINLTNGATIATTASEVSNSHMVTSVFSDSSSTAESGGLSLSSMTLLPSESDIYASTFDGRTSEMHLEKCSPETVIETKKPSLVVETKPCEVSFPAVDLHRGVTEFTAGASNEFRESDKWNSNLTHKHSQREELYTFYEAHMAKLNGLGALSSGVSLDDKGNSLLFKGSAKEGGQFPRSPFSHHADDINCHGGRPVAYHKDASRRKEDMEKRSGSAVDKERRKFSPKAPKDLFPFRSLEGKHADGNRASKQFGAYDKLLRDGR